MPRLVRLGLAIGLVAVAVDLVSLVGGQPHHHATFRPEDHLPHLGALLAMTLMLAGVVWDGVTSQRSHRRGRAAHGGSDHAHR